jgi:hypothetical protein
MAININDEALDALDAAPVEERTKFFNGLSDDERSQLADAVPAWRAKKQAVSGMSQPSPYGNKVEVNPPGDVDLTKLPLASTADEQYAPWYSRVPENPVGRAMFDMHAEAAKKLNDWKDQNIVPAVEAFQKNIGKPIADTMMAAGDDEGRPSDSYAIAGLSKKPVSIAAQGHQMSKDGFRDLSPAHEMLSRQFFSSLAGPEYVDQMSDKEKLEAINALEGNLGANGTAALLGTMHYAGQAPLLLVGAGQARQLGEVLTSTVLPEVVKNTFPTLSALAVTSAGTATEGAAIGGAQALGEKGADVGASMLGGGLLGGAVPGLGKAASLGYKGAKVAVGATLAAGTVAAVKAVDATAGLASRAVDDAVIGTKLLSKPVGAALEKTVTSGRQAAQDALVGAKLYTRPIAILTRSALGHVANEIEKFGHVLAPQDPVSALVGNVETGFHLPEGSEAPGTIRSREKALADAKLSTPFWATPIKDLKLLNPSTAAVVEGPNGGLIGRVVELRRFGAPPKYYDFPLTDVESAEKFDRYLAQNELSPQWSDAAVQNPAMGTDITERIGKYQRQMVTHISPDSVRVRSARITRIDPITPEERAMLAVKDQSGEVQQGVRPGFSYDRRTKTRPDNNVDLGFYPQDLDRPKPTGDMGSVAVTNGDGHILFVADAFDSANDITGNTEQEYWGKVAKQNLAKIGAQNRLRNGVHVPANDSVEYGAVEQHVPPTLPKERPPELPLPKPGEKAWISLAERTREEHNPVSYDEVTVVGPDPKNSANVRVKVHGDQRYDPETREYTPGHDAIVSVPANQVHPQTPPGIADLNHLQPVKTEPLPPPEPGQMTDGQISAVQSVLNLFDYIKKNNVKSGFQKVMDQLLPPHRRYSDELNEFLQRGTAAQHSRAKSEEELLKAIQARLPPGDKAIFGPAARELDLVARGKKKLSDLAPSPAREALRSLAKDLTQELQDNSAHLEALGVLPEGLSAARDAEKVEQYLANVYRAYYLKPGQWAQIAPMKHFDAAVEWIAEQHARRGSVDRLKITNELRQIMNAADPLEALRSSDISKPFASLIKRKEIPPAIRQLLGPETSGPIKVAFALANQRSMIHQIEFWNSLANTRQVDSLGRSINPYFSVGPRPDLHDVPIPHMPNKFGPAAGGFVKKEIYDALVSNVNATQAGQFWLNALGGHIKFNQTVAGGLKPYVNNNVRNIKPALLSGGLDFFHPAESAQHFKQALDLLLEWRKNPTAIGPRALVLEARKLGALPSGFGRTEAATFTKDRVFDTLKKALTEYKPEEGLSGLLDRVRQVGQKASEAYKDKAFEGTEMYDIIGDQWWKFGSYLHLRSKYVKSGMTADAAAQKAALRINTFFPNFENTAPIVQKLRGPLGAAAPYLSGAYEDIRTNGESLRMLARGDRETWENAGKAALALGGLYGSVWAARNLNGINDKMVDEALAVKSNRSSVYRPGIGMLAKPWTEADGSVQFWDMSSWIPELQYMQGHPNDHWASNLAANFLLMPFQGSAMQSVVRSGLEGTGMVTPLPGQYQARPGENRALYAMRAMFQTGLAPGFISKPFDALRKQDLVADSLGGNLGRSEEKTTLAQTAGSLLGMPEAGTVTLPSTQQIKSEQGGQAKMSPSRYGSVMEFSGDMGSYQREMQSVAKSTLPAAEKLRQIQEIAKAMREEAAHQRAVQQAIQQSKQSQQ